MRVFFLTFLGVVVLALAACGQAPGEAPPASADSQTAAQTPAAEDVEPPQSYQAVGVVVSFMAGKTYLNVAHETIPGFMDAMTMPFPVKDTTLLRGLQPGDSIAFRFTVAGGIEAVEKIE